MKRRWYWSLGALCLLVTVFGLSACESTSDSTTEYQMAALTPMEGRVPEALLKRGVTIQVVDVEHETEHDGFVFDGRSTAANERTFLRLVRRYLAAEKGVLILWATNEHKQALREIIGLRFGDRESPGYFVAALPGTKGREFVIVDFPHAAGVDKADFSALAPVEEPGQIEFDDEAMALNQARFLEEYLRGSAVQEFAAAVHYHLASNRERAEQPMAGDPAPPDYLKYKKWYVDQTQSPMVAWRYDTAWLSGYPNPTWRYPAPSPMSGWQQGTYGHTTLITVYLDNDPNNMGQDFQWLTMDHQGWWDTVDGSNHSVSGSGTVEMPLSASSSKKYDVLDAKNYSMYGYGWGVMEYGLNFAPPASETANFKYVNGIPATQITNTTKTETASFNVGFNRAGISSTFGVTKSVATQVPSWQVAVSSQPSASSFSWLWRSNSPDSDKNDIEGFNTMNKSGYEPAAYGVIQTLGIVDRVVTFNAGFGVQKVTSAGYYKAWPAEDHYRTNKTMSNQFTYEVDFGAVLYPLVEQLTINPSSIPGGQNVTGTVTLDQNAPAGGVEVALASNNVNWATVPATVTIPEGQGAQTFTVTTYPVAATSTASISATLNKLTISANLTVTAP
ncbi:MAG: hypothetical protein EOM25_10505 [Deltaproteobacteria bacterium]|nr:hypothetical protein [Deltaproteobacteria bacterium]